LGYLLLSAPNVDKHFYDLSGCFIHAAIVANRLFIRQRIISVD
jgi:hypothetical protein